MIKLSVCMMVKNEEKNIKRCLESLRPILKDVKSELIIIDTGSTDQTVNICKQYTDKIFYHEWNNNFSNMRNTTISYAKGEWIFIIDADEEVIDSSELINFLNKKHPKEINGAVLYLRNIVNLAHTEFSAELVTPRVFKNIPEFKYEGRVHNMPIINGNMLFVKTILNHYGYIVEDTELMEQKYIRTRNLLLQEISKDPSNIYLTFQLSNTYGMHRNYNEAYAESLKAYLMIIDSAELIKQHIYVIGAHVKDCLATERFNEAIVACEKGIAIEKEYIDLYFFAATAFSRLNNYEKAITYYEEYLKMLEKFDDSNFKYNITVQHYSLNKEHEALCNLAIARFLSGKFEESLITINNILPQLNSDSIYYDSVLKIFYLASVKIKQFNKIIDFMKENIEKIDIGIEAIEENIGNLSLDERNRLYTELANLNHLYGKIAYLRLNKDKDMRQYLFDLEDQYLKIDFNSSKFYENEMLYFMIKSKINISSIIDKVHEDRLIEILNGLDSTYSDLVTVISEYDCQKRNLSKSSVRILKKYLMYKSLSSSSEKKCIEEYLGAALDFIKYKFTIEYINDSTDFSGATIEESFLLQLTKIIDLDLSSDVLEELRRLSEEYPEMSCVIKYLLETNDILNEQSDEKDILKKDFIKQILLLKEIGHYSDALILINAYKEISSVDKEILFLESELYLLLMSDKNDIKEN